MPTPKGIREGSIISARMQAFFAIVSRRPGAGRTPFPAVEPPFVPPPPPGDTLGIRVRSGKKGTGYVANDLKNTTGIFKTVLCR